jgi:hypothetical protein
VGDPFDAREQNDTLSLLMIFIKQYQILVRRNWAKLPQCAGLKIGLSQQALSNVWQENRDVSACRCKLTLCEHKLRFGRDICVQSTQRNKISIND